MQLQEALNNPLWKAHKIGNIYSMRNRNGSVSEGWKIAYYPLFESYKNGKLIEFNEPRVLIERPMDKGIDIREIPIRFLNYVEASELA